MAEGVVPVTRFARTPSGSSIAYQVIGGGDATIVSVPPMAQNIELAWEWPAIRQMFEGFGEFCRFIVFDKRGAMALSTEFDLSDAVIERCSGALRAGAFRRSSSRSSASRAAASSRSSLPAVASTSPPPERVRTVRRPSPRPCGPGRR